MKKEKKKCEKRDFNILICSPQRGFPVARETFLNPCFSLHKVLTGNQQLVAREKRVTFLLMVLIYQNGKLILNFFLRDPV